MLILLPVLALHANLLPVTNPPNTTPSLATFVTEAAQRFALSEAVIWAVIRVESRGNPSARSPKGALGLMQLMPQTWLQLRTQYGLGDDPLDPHDNILAGTGYLRQMYDRYGANGYLAAYNAGPGRYEDWLNSRDALPSETLSYVARVSHRVNVPDGELRSAPTVKPKSWTEASLFIATAHSDSKSEQTFVNSGASPFIQLIVPPHATSLTRPPQPSRQTNVLMGPDTAADPK